MWLFYLKDLKLLPLPLIISAHHSPGFSVLLHSGLHLYFLWRTVLHQEFMSWLTGAGVGAPSSLVLSRNQLGDVIYAPEPPYGIGLRPKITRLRSCSFLTLFSPTALPISPGSLSFISHLQTSLPEAWEIWSKTLGLKNDTQGSQEFGLTFPLVSWCLISVNELCIY